MVNDIDDQELLDLFVIPTRLVVSDFDMLKLIDRLKFDDEEPTIDLKRLLQNNGGIQCKINRDIFHVCTAQKKVNDN